MVEEILLGDNPFLGVSHLAHEKARDERREVSRLEAKVEVVKAALEGGASGFTFSTHQSNLELLEYMSKHYPEVFKKLNYYILTPYAQAYVRRANVFGTADLARAVARDIVLRNLLDFITSTTTLNFSRIASLFIGMEVNPYLKTIPRERVKAILLHEVLTELIVAYNLVDLLKKLKRYVERKLETYFGLETRNIGQLRRFLKDNGIYVDYIMTPMNPLGYQMAPSKGDAERALQELADEGVKLIAINILASGAVTLEEACRYVGNYKELVYAVAYGTAKPQRARESASTLRQCLISCLISVKAL